MTSSSPRALPSAAKEFVRHFSPLAMMSWLFLALVLRILVGICTSHRLHHYRNEHFWFGLTNDFGDRVLRTNPAKEEVPASRTARKIHKTNA